MSPQEFQRATQQATQFLKNDLPVIVGVEAVKHFKESFHNEGFTDERLEKWPDISDERKKQKRRKNGDLPPILTDTGDLGESLEWSEEGDRVVIGTDVPYAKRHNEGLDGMPEREFMGPSRQLDQTIIHKIDRELDRLFN